MKTQDRLIIGGTAAAACLAFALWAVLSRERYVDPLEEDMRNRSESYTYDCVTTDEDFDVPEGFRGDVHPILHGRTDLELTAHWSPVSLIDPSGTMTRYVDNSTLGSYSLPQDILDQFLKPEVAQRRRTYGAEDFSVLLPQELSHVGQLWSIDEMQAARFLEQIHPRPATEFTTYGQPYGRRPGPPGAFGVVRALSETHADVLFRLHAEFILQPNVVYTPACFLGRMLIDRQSGTVESFQMKVPTERSLNLTLTVSIPHPDDLSSMVSTLLFERVDQVELIGGDEAMFETTNWTAEMDVAHAHETVKRPFYRFLEIDWVPYDDVLRRAEIEKKPILAVVMTSPLDDQSC